MSSATTLTAKLALTQSLRYSQDCPPIDVCFAWLTGLQWGLLAAMGGVFGPNTVEHLGCSCRHSGGAGMIPLDGNAYKHTRMVVETSKTCVTVVYTPKDKQVGSNS